MATLCHSGLINHCSKGVSQGDHLTPISKVINHCKKTRPGQSDQYLRDYIFNELSLVKVIAWCRIGVKTLPEGTMSQFTPSMSHHQASRGYYWDKIKPSKPISNIAVFLLTIGKTPVRIILWYPTTKMLINACFLIQPLEQEGRY